MAEVTAPIGRCRARYGRGQNPREGRVRAPGGFRLPMLIWCAFPGLGREKACRECPFLRFVHMG